MIISFHNLIEVFHGGVRNLYSFRSRTGRNSVYLNYSALSAN